MMRNLKSHHNGDFFYIYPGQGPKEEKATLSH